MKRRFFYRYFLIALAVLIIFGCSDYPRSPGTVKKVCYNQHCLNVRLAATPSEREQGLMFRKNLPQGQGMLFVFDQPARYGFWMKNTYIPLDIIWFDENLEVVYIKERAQPCLEKLCQPIIPDQKARYVLEANGGFVDESGIRVGDKLNFVHEGDSWYTGVGGGQ